eukprot:TRINITY_DN3306_c0_g1_i1.p1 TRINITY_DN3306_c0_g1~~TRINITY_DN3306_c0_g1_i1.p1  ORF type:complete len:256 (-),score=40.40 TRINITY_DN3306_c0_g1_i1:50-817(-)
MQYQNQYNPSPNAFAGRGNNAQGGYMNSPMRDTADDAAGEGRSMRSFPTQALMPVTIRQLHGAIQGPMDDNGFRIDGKEIYLVTFVARIRSVTVQNTQISFLFDDGTGQIEALTWLDQTGDKASRWREETYVRVAGHMRSTNFLATKIRPIEDFNEITYHFLEAIHVHLYNFKGPADSTTTTTSYSTGVPIENAILNVISTCPLAEGASVHFILQQLSNLRTNEFEVRQILNSLVKEAHIFPTIDDDHFKTADQS